MNKKALVPTISSDELERQVDAEVPSLAGGFQLQPRRLSRIGKLHLGYRLTNTQGKEYPKEASWFVFEDPNTEADLVARSPERYIVEVDGVKHLAAVEIIFPCNRIDENVEIAWCRYNSMRQLVCTSKDGVTCRRTDPETGEIGEGECLNENCPDTKPPAPNKAAACGQLMRMRFIIPQLPGLGVWQLDTKSKWSMTAVLGYMRDLKAKITRGQLAGIRLRLWRASEMIPDKGTKHLRQHWPLHLVCPLSFDEYQDEVSRARAMTYEADLVEGFDEAVSEDLLPAEEENGSNGNGAGLDAAPQEAEFVCEEAGVGAREPVGEPVQAESPSNADLIQEILQMQKAARMNDAMFRAFVNGVTQKAYTGLEVLDEADLQLVKSRLEGRKAQKVVQGEV